MTTKKAGGPAHLSALADKREFVMRLVLAELIARPGEGPLTPRFARPAPGFAHGGVARDNGDSSARGPA
jgi:hypothetical protein